MANNNDWHLDYCRRMDRGTKVPENFCKCRTCGISCFRTWISWWASKQSYDFVVSVWLEVCFLNQNSKSNTIISKFYQHSHWWCKMIHFIKMNIPLLKTNDHNNKTSNVDLPLYFILVCLFHVYIFLSTHLFNSFITYFATRTCLWIQVSLKRILIAVFWIFLALAQVCGNYFLRVFLKQCFLSIYIVFLFNQYIFMWLK